MKNKKLPVIRLKPWHVLPHFMFTTMLWSKYNRYPILQMKCLVQREHTPRSRTLKKSQGFSSRLRIDSVTVWPLLDLHVQLLTPSAPTHTQPKFPPVFQTAEFLWFCICYCCLPQLPTPQPTLHLEDKCLLLQGVRLHSSLFGELPQVDLNSPSTSR